MSRRSIESRASVRVSSGQSFGLSSRSGTVIIATRHWVSREAATFAMIKTMKTWWWRDRSWRMYQFVLVVTQTTMPRLNFQATSCIRLWLSTAPAVAYSKARSPILSLETSSLITPPFTLLDYRPTRRTFHWCQSLAMISKHSRRLPGLRSGTRRKNLSIILRKVMSETCRGVPKITSCKSCSQLSVVVTTTTSTSSIR